MQTTMNPPDEYANDHILPGTADAPEALEGDQQSTNDVTMQPGIRHVTVQPPNDHDEQDETDEEPSSVADEKGRYLHELGYVRDALLSHQDIYTYLALAPPIGAMALAQGRRLSHASQRPVSLRRVFREHPFHYWILDWIISLVQWTAPIILFFTALFDDLWEKTEEGVPLTLPFSYTVKAHIPLIVFARLLSVLLFLSNFNNAIMSMMRQVYYWEICGQFLDPLNRWLYPGQTEYSPTNSIQFVRAPLRKEKTEKAKEAKNIRWRIFKKGIRTNWTLTWVLLCIVLPLILWLELNPQDVILNSLAFNFVLNLDDLGDTQQVLLLKRDHVVYCFAEVTRKWDLLCVKFEEACNKVIASCGTEGFVQAYGRITDRFVNESIDCPKCLSQDEHAMLRSIIETLRSSWEQRRHLFVDGYVYIVGALIAGTFCHPPYIRRYDFIGFYAVSYLVLGFCLSEWLGDWKWGRYTFTGGWESRRKRLRRVSPDQWHQPGVTGSGESSPVTPVSPVTRLIPVSRAR
ncbi:unnamed protein product [Vitrella brassicaformis CCMP3155]|uniref:Uncharacterized protein n=2 Tax=Vitrella brassicaformis TaxID=1169539 RepID=A0A0G4GTD2_VITBC|nr:unnamed protein product [Vitrella brassicaformis CCMP3155]|eukprot:CEM34031.1 unnamed protein product [Vitrella brassicaformis CCMP3155]